MLALKTYQKNTLDKLAAYLERVRLLGYPARPFAELCEAQGYSDKFRPLQGLEDIPYVCLRLPTGGGKTLLAAHAIKVAAEAYLETEYPIVLLLVPTDAIRSQTLETLKNPRHPNRQVLDEHFDGRVRVFDITDFQQLRPQDIGEAVCVFVGTFATLRVDDTKIRKAYAHHEDLEPHFSRIPPADWLEKDKGQVKFSFANLLAHHRPLVIVDEAHNHKTKLSEEVLRRVRAAAVVEFTATPAPDSNVMYKVSAAELKVEEMIKLPVRLSEHLAWTDAVTAAIQNRERLQTLADAEDEYIRPIVLFQAQDKNEEVTVEKLVAHLVEQEKIPREAIAVATGTQRELDGVNLFDRSSPIRFVVTVEALKEGWDCSFAYVFCSVAKVRSGKDAEQLLGRVLRMPYAKRRKSDDLNLAFAHLPVVSWMEGLARIKDNLLGMGFEEQEVQENVQIELPFDPEGKPMVIREEIAVYSTEKPDTTVLTLALQAEAKVETTADGGYKTTFTVTSRDEARELCQRAGEIFRDNEARTALVRELVKPTRVYKPLTPSEMGQTIVVPMLCLDFGDGDLRPAEKQDFLPEGVNLTKFPVSLEAFQVSHEEHVYEIDIQGAKVRERALTVQETLNLPGGVTHWTEANLVRWLDKRLRQTDVLPAQMLEFLRRHVQYLREERRVPLAELVRLRFLLEKTLRDRICALRDQAYKDAIQQTLFETTGIVRVCSDVPTVFRSAYPANATYTGSFQFGKHFFQSIGNMEPEEAECAKAIDSHQKVDTWVRNLSNQPKSSFWLQTHQDKFYPDFVVKRKDGKILVVEYKGKGYVTNDDSKEKDMLGRRWAEETGGQCQFLMAVKKDAAGRDVWGQLDAVLR